MTDVSGVEPSRTNRVVVLVGTDADALGTVARELEDAGDRAAVFVDDVSSPEGRAALREMIHELFSREETGALATEHVRVARQVLHLERNRDLHEADDG